MTQPFLTARWQNLVLLNFVVPPVLLRPRLPPGLEVELYRGDAFVSLVAFDFLETRVKGIAWPGHVDFPEINLRFYVRCGPERGVVFVREWVPRRMIAWIARHLYDEPYSYAPMESAVEKDGARITVEHQLHLDGRTHRLRVPGREPPLMAPPGSLEDHFKEHRWGFGVDRRGQPTYYEVQHPRWFCHPVEEVELDWSWGDVYGPDWAFLDGQQPDSAILAVGSEVQVFPRNDLE